MMKTLYLFVLLVTICFYQQNTFAQSKYGNATMDELTMLSYPQDTVADALILLKKGDTKFVYSDLYGFQFEYTVQTKIKILKTEGLEWCNQEINYYFSNNWYKEQINNLSGTTYNLEDGNIVKTKLTKEFIFDEDIDNKLKVKKFTLPAAKVGSVIEFKYTIVSDFYYNLRDFEFQTSIPTLYTYFEATLPEYFKYNLNQQGYISLKTSREPANDAFHIRYKDDYGRTQTSLVRCIAEKIKFEGFDIPSIKKENYLWSINDYISKVSFELRSVQYPYSMVKNYTTTWTDIDKDIFETFKGDLKKSDLFKNEVAKTEINLEKATEIQNMVKNKVKWNDKNTINVSNLKEALTKGIGNSADMNFLLINALQAGRFDAFPVILSTRDKGRIPVTHPSSSAFNYVITGIQIDTTMYFTDASAEYGDWNLLPQIAMVPQARIMKQNNTGWVDLTSISTGVFLTTAQYSFEDSQYQGKIAQNTRGNAAYYLRSNYNKHKNKEEYIESLSKTIPGDIDDLEISNLDNTAEPMKMTFTQKMNVNLGDEYLYLNPMAEKLFSENPFKKEQRMYPVNFDFLINYNQIVDITVPEGYIVEELPKTERVILNDNDIAFSYRMAQTENKIKLIYQFQLKKLTFLPDEYESLQDLFSKVILKNSEQIVLKKTSE